MTNTSARCPKCDHAAPGEATQPSWLRSVLGKPQRRPACTELSEAYLEKGSRGDGLCGCRHPFHEPDSTLIPVSADTVRMDFTRTHRLP